MKIIFSVRSVLVSRSLTKGVIWDSLDEISLPLEDLEREFCHCQPVKREKPKKEKPKRKKIETAKFLDPKRSQQVGIFIQSMKAKSEELFEALVTLNIKMDIDLMKGNGQRIHIEGVQFRLSTFLNKTPF